MIVSIDIGTSYSSISFLGPDGKAQAVDIGTGMSMFGSKYSLPSAVFVEEDGTILLGHAALNNRMRNPQNFRDEFKRNLGENVPFLLGGKQFLPEDLYREFFIHMNDCVKKVTGESIELAYLTYPAAYGEKKKKRIISAAKSAGLFQQELIDEPTAAAMSYYAAGYIKENQNLLVYDFGGGTFDAAVVSFKNGKFSTLGEPKGLERCGGIDIDRLIFQDMMSKVEPEKLQMLQGDMRNYTYFVTQLSELAVKCKHHLSASGTNMFQEDIPFGFERIPYQLTVEQFNQMIAELIGQTIQLSRHVVQDAGLEMTDLSAILLVGGTSRVPLVQTMVKQMAGGVAVYCAADLELAVSQGALQYHTMKRADADASEEKEKAEAQLETEERKPAAEAQKSEAEAREEAARKEKEEELEKRLAEIREKRIRKEEERREAAKKRREEAEWRKQEAEWRAKVPFWDHPETEMKIVKTIKQAIEETPVMAACYEDYNENSLTLLKISLRVMPDEYVLLYHDDSWFKRGANGFILTNKAIYCKPAFGGTKRTSLKYFMEAKDLEITFDEDNRYPSQVFFGEDEIFYHSVIGKEGILEVVEFWKELQRRLVALKEEYENN